MYKGLFYTHRLRESNEFFTMGGRRRLKHFCKCASVKHFKNILDVVTRRGGSSPKVQGTLLPLLLHHRVHFLRSPKPKKYELYIGLHLKSVIMVANSVMG